MKLGHAASNVARAAQDAMAETPTRAKGDGKEPLDDRRLLRKWKFLRALARDPKMSKTRAVNVALVILDSYDRRRGVFECGYGKIAEGAGMTTWGAQFLVDKLITEGWFLKLSGGLKKDGSPAPNQYFPQWSRAEGV